MWEPAYCWLRAAGLHWLPEAGLRRAYVLVRYGVLQLPHSSYGPGHGHAHRGSQHGKGDTCRTCIVQAVSRDGQLNAVYRCIAVSIH